MNREKKKLSTFSAVSLLIGSISVLAILYALYRMFAAGEADKTPHISLPPPDETTTSGSSSTASSTSYGMIVTMSEEKTLSLIGEALPEDYPVRLDKLRFCVPDAVLLGGTLNLKKLAESAGGENRLVAILGGLLPEAAPFTAELGIAAEGEELSIVTRSLMVSDLSVPVEYLPSEVTDKLSSIVKDAAANAGFRIRELSVGDGFIRLSSD